MKFIHNVLAGSKLNAVLLICFICTVLLGIHATGYEKHRLQTRFFSKLDSIENDRPVKRHVKPNIILIMADDLGQETLKSYGGESYHTPNLDKLAATGMQFQNCYSTPLCTTSRVQLMTGKYNFRNYIGFGLLDPNEPTIGHAMKEAGYET